MISDRLVWQPKDFYAVIRYKLTRGTSVSLQNVYGEEAMSPQMGGRCGVTGPVKENRVWRRSLWVSLNIY
ncbi:hypothetical protein TNCV_2264021 [Trichonephila clavipes]|nr:hypothetical protein TNCV_2264021 [Trichonephila clavipes]